MCKSKTKKGFVDFQRKKKYQINIILDIRCLENVFVINTILESLKDYY